MNSSLRGLDVAPTIKRRDILAWSLNPTDLPLTYSLSTLNRNPFGRERS